MTDAQLSMLIAMRTWQKQSLRETEDLLRQALGKWSRERGFLMRLTPEQAMREMGGSHA